MVGSVLRKTIGLDIVARWWLWSPTNNAYSQTRFACCFGFLGMSSRLTRLQLLGGVFLGGFMLLSPLTLALAYTYAQENPTRQLSYFIITFSAKWLPLTMLAMTVIMDSPYSAVIQATGLVAAHAYEFLTKTWPEHGGGRRLLNTPAFVQKWFATPGGAPTRRGAGTAFSARPASAQSTPQRQAGGGGGWASGFSGGNWGERGQGRRLGD